MWNNPPRLIQAWERLAYHRQGGLRRLIPLLYPAAVLYGVMQRIRRGVFQSGILKGAEVGVPVISVGNLTLGGVGKTPFTMYLAQRLRSMGFTPAILFRGYKRQSDQPILLTTDTFQTEHITRYGDEPAMVCFTAGIPCGIYRMRFETARRMVEERLCDILLLDDGLQHLQLHRDIDIVLLDGTQAVGNRMCLPMGPLREPLSTLSRIHAVVFRDTEDCSILPRSFSGHSFIGSLQWQAISPFPSWAKRDFSSDFSIERYHAQAVILVSGIGNPSRLARQAESHGLNIVNHIVFPDHYWIRVEDIMKAGASDPSLPLWMTEKDAIRLLGIRHHLPDHLQQRIHVIQTQWHTQNEAEFTQWLQTTVASI